MSKERTRQGALPLEPHERNFLEKVSFESSKTLNGVPLCGTLFLCFGDGSINRRPPAVATGSFRNRSLARTAAPLSRSAFLGFPQVL
jgi:hypothetical protein